MEKTMDQSDFIKPINGKEIEPLVNSFSTYIDEMLDSGIYNELVEQH